MTATIDAHVKTNTGAVTTNTSKTITITTTLTNDVIVLYIALNPLANGTTPPACTISSVSSPSLTWSQRGNGNGGPAGNSATQGLWWAVAAKAVTSEVITVQYTPAAACCLEAVAWNGINTTTPFDSVVTQSICVNRSGATFTSDSVTGISTSNANDVLLAFLFLTDDTTGDARTATVPTSFTSIDTDHTLVSSNVNGVSVNSAYQIVSSTQSGLTETWSWTNSDYDYMMADALQIAGAVSTVNWAAAAYELRSVGTLTIAAAPTTNLLSSNFVPTANGTIVLSIGITASAPTAVAQILRGATRWALNGNTALTAGCEYEFSLPVQAGDDVNFSMATGTTLGLLQAYFTEDI